MFLKFLVTILIFSNVSLCLKGGTELSQTETSLNKYGVGQFLTTDSEKCICVLVLPGPYCLYMEGCGFFDNSTVDPRITVMGKEFDGLPHSRHFVAQCPGYQSSYETFQFDNPPPVSAVAATLPDPSQNYVPPAGTKCQILGFSSTTNNIPNKVEVFVIDFASCKAQVAISDSYLAANLNEKRHFCAPVVLTPPTVPTKPEDLMTPVFCKNWAPKKSFGLWPFSKDDEEDEEDVNEGPLVFIGFVRLFIAASDAAHGLKVLLVNEAFQCPN